MLMSFWLWVPIRLRITRVGSSGHLKHVIIVGLSYSRLILGSLARRLLRTGTYRYGQGPTSHCYRALSDTRWRMRSITTIMYGRTRMLRSLLAKNTGFPMVCLPGSMRQLVTTTRQLGITTATRIIMHGAMTRCSIRGRSSNY